jgi:hypothetical protein
VKQEISPPVMIAVISGIVVVIVMIGWFAFRPAGSERVAPHQADQTRTSLLKQRMGQGQMPSAAGANP